jgi:sugar phosphate permease
MIGETFVPSRSVIDGRDRNPWGVFAVLSLMFVISQFYRVSNAVIARDLVRDLGISAEGLGFLGGAFFYSFALVQVPMGAALDRIGPRIMITILPLVSALGAFLFALSHGFALALFARFLIGLGMACVLMGTFKALTAWFPAEKFATMTGLTYSVGTLGNVLATSPLAYLAAHLGWRISMVIIGVATALTSALVFKIVRDRPKGSMEERGAQNPPPGDKPIPVRVSLRMIFGSFAFWQMAPVNFFRYGTFVAIQGLWGGPYLMDVLGYSPIKAGNVLMMMSLGVIIGSPIGGRLSDRILRSRKKVVIAGMSAYAVGIFLLIGWTRISHEVFYYGLFFFLGFFMSFGMVIFSHIKELFDTRMSATAMTGVNFFVMIGAAVSMHAMGKIIEVFPKVDGVYPPRAYHVAFLTCLVGIAIAVTSYSFSKDTRPDSPRKPQTGLVLS